MCWVSSFRQLLALTWRLGLNLRRLTKSAENLSVLPRSFPLTGQRSTAGRDLWIFWELAVRPMRTSPYRGLVIRLKLRHDSVLLRSIKETDMHPLGTQNFALKITDKVLHSRRASHHVVVSSQDGWDSTRFKAVNKTTFYCSERVLRIRSDVHARMYETASRLWQIQTQNWS